MSCKLMAISQLYSAVPQMLPCVGGRITVSGTVQKHCAASLVS